MSKWVEEEITLPPGGPFAGERYRHRRHPVSRLWFQAVDSGKWSRFSGTGPTQNGKTLMLYVAPVLYHLFELGETVIVGVPSMDMASDKWAQDFLPVIRACRYRDLLPHRGEGSKGGQIKRSITFRNGATLRFMSAGGGDKKRAGYTSRVLAVTETDGMDEAGGSSREADKIEQLEGRTRAFGRTGKRVYLECTVSIEKGRIWQEVQHKGTGTRIARPCPHCGEYVTPEREHLTGWQDATSEEEASEQAFWSCPACGEAWTEVERREASELAVLVHRGQEIDRDGAVTGDAPKTQTFGLRWSAIDNPFVSAADLGAEEWLARASVDRDNAERKMRQFVWAIPHESPEIDLTPLDPVAIQSRVSGLKRGVLPDDCLAVAIGVDTGKRRLHWECKAVRANGSLPVIEYGLQPVDSDRLGTFRGLVEALRKLAAYFDNGWSTADGRTFRPAQVWIDSAYHEHTDAVYAICAELNHDCQPGAERYRPIRGYGEGQRRMTQYRAPSSKTEDVLYIGRELYIARVRRNGAILGGVMLVHINSDHWKSEFHQRLAMPPDEPGAITLFDTPSPYEHAEYCAHITAERQIEKQLPSKRVAIVFETIRRENHYGDAGYVCTAAGALLFDNHAKRRPASRPRRGGISYL